MASDGTALTGLWFDGQKYFGDTLPKEYEEKPLPIFEQSVHWLDIYFSGKAPDFTPSLCMQTTPFRKSVWENEECVSKWRNFAAHRMAQEHGRMNDFADYKITVVTPVRSYTMMNRTEAPADSNEYLEV